VIDIGHADPSAAVISSRWEPVPGWFARLLRRQSCDDLDFEEQVGTTERFDDQRCADHLGLVLVPHALEGVEVLGPGEVEPCADEVVEARVDLVEDRLQVGVRAVDLGEKRSRFRRTSGRSCAPR
jgi:hypothetical protein